MDSFFYALLEENKKQLDRDQENFWLLIQEWTRKINLWSLPGDYQCAQTKNESGKWIEKPSIKYKKQGDKGWPCMAFHSHNIKRQPYEADLRATIRERIDDVALDEVRVA